MNLDISTLIRKGKKQFLRFIRRFHVILFVVSVASALAVVIIILNAAVIRSGEDDGYTSSSANTAFDQATINRIKNLKTRDQADDQLDLSGRSNPFVE